MGFFISESLSSLSKSTMIEDPSTPIRSRQPLRAPIGEPLKAIIAQEIELEVEIGTGKGLFLAAAAPQNPGHFFVGVELARKYASYAQQKLEQLAIANAQVFCADGVAVMCQEIPPQRLAAVHVYFPDPWWKARHKKRRVLNEDMLRGIEKSLKPGGLFHFWTDVLDYYEATLELVREVTQLQGPNFVDEKVAGHDLDYLTHFERRTRLNGLPVYRCYFAKSGS